MIKKINATKILMQVQSLRPPKGNSMHKRTHHTTYASLRTVHPFCCSIHPVNQPPKSYGL